MGDITFFDKNPNGTTLISLRNGKIVTFDDPDDVYFDQLVKYADGLTEAKDNHWAGVLDDLRKRERMELNKYAGIADPEFRPID